MHQHAPVVCLPDEVGEHLFGHFEIGDYTVLHRPNRDHVSRRPSKHLLSLAAHCDHFAAVLVDGHDRGLVHDDSFASGEYERVCRSQINR